MVGNSGMRLSKRAMHLISTEVRKDHSGGVVVRRRWQGALSRRVESPLQEVNLSSSSSSLEILCIGFIGGDLRARERKHELRVLTRCLDNALVCVQWDNCGDRVRVFGVAEAPEGFNFLGWEIANLLDV